MAGVGAGPTSEARGAWVSMEWESVKEEEEEEEARDSGPDKGRWMGGDSACESKHIKKGVSHEAKQKMRKETQTQTENRGRISELYTGSAHASSWSAQRRAAALRWRATWAA